MRCLCDTATIVEGYKSFVSLSLSPHLHGWVSFLPSRLIMISIAASAALFLASTVSAAVHDVIVGSADAAQIYTPSSLVSGTLLAQVPVLTNILVCFSWGSDHLPLQTSQPYGDAVIV